MNTIKDLQQELNTINQVLKDILKRSRFNEYSDLSGLEYDSDSPEELLLVDELQDVLYRLDEASNIITYLNKPIRKKGILAKSCNGRYTYDGRELTCGCCIEALVPEDDRHKWISTRIEHDGNDYYLVGYKGSLSGLLVRERA